MKPCDPEALKPLRVNCDAPNPSPRVTRVLFVLAIIALIVGAGFIVGGQVPPGLILVLAGVAGILAKIRCSPQGSGAGARSLGAPTEDSAASESRPSQ